MPAVAGQDLYVGVTDFDWFAFLSRRPELGEVNFWRPGGGLLRPSPGAPFLFKLKKPHNAIAGVGFFETAEQMTIADAWEFFGEANGVPSAAALLAAIGRNRNDVTDFNHRIGCVILSQPTFFDPTRWIPQPPEWKLSTQVAAKYDMTSGVGERLWRHVEAELGERIPPRALSPMAPFGGFRQPAIFLPRQGQGTFRRQILAAYGNRCAVTGERTVPVVEAAHIKDFSLRRRHEIENGVALRSDVHKLFDRGYVSIRPDNVFVVSRALADDFSNGKIYYERHSQPIRLPENPALHPKPEYLEEHYETKFKR